MLYRTFLFLILTLSFSGAVAHAQNPADPFGRDRVSAIELELRARRDLKAAEKEHRENLNRAQEAAQLGTELRDAYANYKSLGRVELKKLERLEKLARRIRSEAGGSDDRDTNMEKAPTQLESAFSRLAEVSEEVRKGVEKTPRQVISASVIERANELLDIITYIRNQTR
jgi:vacuolar-type H+-ATPase subunit I/STV1